VRAYLYDVPEHDPGTYAGAVLVLLAVMVLATMIGIFLLGRRELDRQGG